VPKKGDEVKYEITSDAEGFGSVYPTKIPKPEDVGKATVAHWLTMDETEQLRDCLIAAVAHAKRFAHQEKPRTKKRSHFEPINVVMLTTNLKSGQMTVLGQYRKQFCPKSPILDISS